MSQIEDHQEIQQYLLGTLSEEARQGLEERLLAEDDFFEELLSSEDELIDLYINEQLSGEDRDRFERYFLSTTERHRKLRFARTLSRYVSNKSEEASVEEAEKSSLPARVGKPTALTWTERWRVFWTSQGWALRTACGLLVLAILAGALWLAFQRPSSHRTFAALTLTLNVNNNRDESAQASKVSLPLNASALRITLMLPGQPAPAARYRVESVNADGEARTLEIAAQDARSIAVEIPAARLARGPYALRLFMTRADGTEQRINGNYFFTVE